VKAEALRRLLGALAASALICAPAAAETRDWVPNEAAVAARLAQVGTWEFTATKRGPDGQPECRESWTFRADNTGLIVSGKQQVSIKWWVRRDAGIGQWLFITDVSTTAGPDCLGKAIEASEFPDGRGQPGVQLLFYADGESALLCSEGNEVTRPDGSTYNALDPADCWGRIVPAPKV
jgi:hypothetical protein